MRFLVNLILMLFHSGGFLSKDDFALIIKNYILSQLKSKPVEVKVEVLSAPFDVPSGLRLELIPQAWAKPGGIKIFKFELYEKGRLKRRFIVQARVRTFDSVFVAVRALRSGEIISEDMFRKEKIETTFLKGNYVKNFTKVSGKRLRRFINAGDVLFYDSVEDIPLVRRGEKVRIEVVSRFVRVETTGVAKQDGWLGDKIKVFVNASRKTIEGEVSGKGTVRIYVE